MNKLIIEIETEENFTPTEVEKINNIFHALIRTGGLLGMKNGNTGIHFDKNGEFQAVSLNYTAWRNFS